MLTLLVDFRGLHVCAIQRNCRSALVGKIQMHYPRSQIDYPCILWPICSRYVDNLVVLLPKARGVL